MRSIVPGAAAMTLVPLGAMMSIASCRRAPPSRSARKLSDRSSGRTFSTGITSCPRSLERGRVALACEDAQAAVDLINGELARPGHTADPVRAGVRAFEIGDGVEDWVYPRVDAFVDACTPEAVLAGLPAGASFVLTAEHDAQARFGESIVHAMSGESLAGSAEPMIYVVLAEIDEATGFAGIRKLHIPLSWSDLPHGEGAVSPVFRYEAIEVRGWTIEPDGARGHGESAGGVESVSIPCADPQAGAEALEAFRDEASR